jgi:hypothetical protein
MPWQEVVTVELRQQFVHDARRRVVPVTELCAAYGIAGRPATSSWLATTPSGPRASPISPVAPTVRRRRSIPCCSRACSRLTTAIPTGGLGSCSAS